MIGKFGKGLKGGKHCKWTGMWGAAFKTDKQNKRSFGFKYILFRAFTSYLLINFGIHEKQSAFF